MPSPARPDGPAAAPARPDTPEAHGPLPQATDAPAVAGPGVAYRCRHITRYSYAEPVTGSQLIAHLAPRPHPHQRGGIARLLVEPAPAVAVDRLDWFGNPVTYAAIDTPHRSLTVTAELEIAVEALPLPDPATTPPWERVAAAAAAAAEPVEFLQPSPLVPVPDAALSAALADFTAPSFPPGRPVLAGLLDLTRRIQAEFTFETGVTSPGTPVAEVLRLRRGVCQDFAHLMIAALRPLGLPARYVSGYLRTLPPPGQPRLVGADASHAWVQAWAGPDPGWIDLDPTNGRPADTDHITLAWGRDYDDVCPLRGVILGGGAQTLEVSVDVEPLG